MGYKHIISNIPKLRDPFVLVVGDTYYVYGSEWLCYKSKGDLKSWERVDKEIVVTPLTYVKQNWAPEVHVYNGAYYMFTTYYSSAIDHRGCTILRSDSPEGPFVEITNGTVTPKNWDCIDGTLYIAPDGQPWMVFVHEWTCMPDKVGTMAAAKLSADLAHFISEPIELFRADAPEWATDGVTDGCFLYTCADGTLLMLWSNFCAEGYCEAIARSDNGKIDGTWSQNKERLYLRSASGTPYDGGHGMIFTGLDGKKYLSLHSPNAPIDERMETPIFIEVREENGTLTCVSEDE